jgi:hypothetical protein
MALIDRIVDIKITRATKGIKRDEFSTILVIGNSTDSDVVKEYFSAAEVKVDYAADSQEYLIATRIFGQAVSVNKILIGQTKAGESLVDSYTRIGASYTFYAVVIADDISITLANYVALAAAVEADDQPKMLALQEYDLSGLALMTAIHAANYDRTFVIYNAHDNAGKATYANAAWLGALLPTDPGTANWAFKTLAGIVADTPISAGSLTSAKITQIESLNGNYYTNMAGRDATFNGKMGGGEFIDIIYGVDWLENTMQQDVANIYFTNPKIPYTVQGISLIETAMRASLELGVKLGVLSGYTITTPDINTITADTKATRSLTGLTFSAVVTGAINKVTINGFVTI